jgi:hypothetical protein
MYLINTSLHIESTQGDSVSKVLTMLMSLSTIGFLINQDGEAQSHSGE